MSFSLSGEGGVIRGNWNMAGVGEVVGVSLRFCCCCIGDENGVGPNELSVDVVEGNVDGGSDNPKHWMNYP